jgi:hypothetical protein
METGSAFRKNVFGGRQPRQGKNRRHVVVGLGNTLAKMSDSIAQRRQLGAPSASTIGLASLTPAGRALVHHAQVRGWQITFETDDRGRALRVCTENFIRVDDVLESPKLVE